MCHDEVVDREGQDPGSHLPCDLWEKHYRERIAHYERLLSGTPAVEFLRNELAKYTHYLAEHLASISDAQ